MTRHMAGSHDKYRESHDKNMTRTNQTVTLLYYTANTTLVIGVIFPIHFFKQWPQFLTNIH